MPANPQSNAAVITVTTAVEMDDALRAKAYGKVVELYGSDVKIIEKVDPKILGGIVIEGADRRFDASVRAQLAAVRSSLSTTFTGGAA